MTIPDDLKMLAAITDIDPDVRLMMPPIEICVLLEAGDDDACVFWVSRQRELQDRAAEIWAQLNDGGELDDPARRGLPGWITEWWAPVLSMPWSARLEEAVAQAEYWRDSVGTS